MSQLFRREKPGDCDILITRYETDIRCLQQLLISKRNRIGDIRDIYVNPDDPEDIYVNRLHRRNIVYVLFVIVGVILTAYLFAG